MTNEQKLFMEALKASLNHTSVHWSSEDHITAEVLQSVYELAAHHNVVPMIYEAIYSCDAVKALQQVNNQQDNAGLHNTELHNAGLHNAGLHNAGLHNAGVQVPQIMMQMKQRTIYTSTIQVMKTQEFYQLYEKLGKMGIRPVVTKGIICRSLYPNPDSRPSNDEDLWIPKQDAKKTHEALLACGMHLLEDVNVEQAREIPYGRENSSFFVELHTDLFEPDSDAYGDWNFIFKDSMERTVDVTIEGHSLRTMEVTDHLLYLIFHALKHFLHSGVGIRQICDIAVFANHYGTKIDWERLLSSCRKVNGEKFAAAVFKIGEKYLNFDPKQAAYPGKWQDIQVDEEHLLEDLLGAGVYGNSSMSRIHSSNITLSAVSDDKSASHSDGAAHSGVGKNGLIRSLFPPADTMKDRYPYLQEKPYLLPKAWLNRIITYRRETKAGGNNSAVESLKIGKERVQLLREYGIIKK